MLIIQSGRFLFADIPVGRPLSGLFFRPRGAPWISQRFSSPLKIALLRLPCSRSPRLEPSGARDPIPPPLRKQRVWILSIDSSRSPPYPTAPCLCSPVLLDFIEEAASPFSRC